MPTVTLTAMNTSKVQLAFLPCVTVSYTNNTKSTKFQTGAISRWRAKYAQIQYILRSALHLIASLNPPFICNTTLLLFAHHRILNSQHSPCVVVPSIPGDTIHAATHCRHLLVRHLQTQLFKMCRSSCSSLSQ